MNKVLSVFIIVCFIVTGQIGVFPVYAQDYVLPAPGVMVPLSPVFNPPILKGIKVHSDDPFSFDFILDQGDHYRGQLKQDATRLIKYFLAGLTIPENDLWVNLSPYEKDRIIPQSFGLTEMGRDLLAQDYMLKQITASLIYPEGETGKKFWKRIYEEASRKFGTTNIPVNTFNKVWIVPEKAVVYENAKAGTAYVVEAKLKVMLEQDYLSLEKHSVILSAAKDHKTPLDSSAAPQNDMNTLGSQIVREIVIPELNREVNEGKNFAQLRQVYNSLILAAWYKKKIRDSILEKVYADKKKVAGVGYKNSINVEAIYQRYLQAFKKGVYNYIKEEQDPISEKVEPRKYFSGGFSGMSIDQAMIITNTQPVQKTGLIDILCNLKMMFTKARQDQIGDRFSLWGRSIEGEDDAGRDRLIDLIDADVRDAYAYASRNFNKDQTPGIWAVGACKELVKKFLLKKFHRKGFDIKLIEYRSDFKGIEFDIKYHAFIIIFYQGRVWILDPTWQQFLLENEDRTHLPKALLVDVARLYKKLDELKVLKNNRFYWYSALSKDLQSVSKESFYQDLAIHEPQPAALNPNDKAMLSDVFIKRLIAKATDDIHLVGLSNTAIPFFLKLNEVSGRTHRWLYTKRISVKDLPPDYPVALREPDYFKELPGFINVNLPESDIILTSYSSNGSSGVLRLASLVDGTPVALKARYSGSIEEDNRLILKDYLEAFTLDMLGIGPRLHGLFRDGYGRINMVMDIVPGDVLKSAKEFITSGSIADLGEINRRLIIDEKSMSFDMNYLITPAGRVLLIDPERINETSLDPTDEGYIKYLLELLEYANPKVQKETTKNLKKDKELSNKIENYIDQQEKGKNTGGIDLTAAIMNLQTQNAGEGIKFRLDPAMLQQLQNAPGFVPVIINIQPMTDLKIFLGAENDQPASP